MRMLTKKLLFAEEGFGAVTAWRHNVIVPALAFQRRIRRALSV
jgi:hypothetical protein